jgi:ribosomal protein L40E
MCYEELTHCVNEDKHEDGFVFSVESTVNDSENNKEKDNNKNPDIIICPRCKTEAPKGAFYCGKCGFPIGINKNADSHTVPQNKYDTPKHKQESGALCPTQPRSLTMRTYYCFLPLP